MHFKMSSAICFNLDQFKILSSGNGLNNICRNKEKGSSTLDVSFIHYSCMAVGSGPAGPVMAGPNFRLIMKNCPLWCFFFSLSQVRKR